MKQLPSILALSFVVFGPAVVVVLATPTAVLATPPSLEWTRQIGTIDQDISHSVFVDNVGNVYISGETREDLDGGGPGAYAGGFGDAFLTKYDTAGNLLWIEQLGTSGVEGSSGVTVDSLGNVFISGSTGGDLDGGGPGTHSGMLDAFLSKYDAAGNRLWIEQIGTSGSDSSYGVTTDGIGNVYN